MIFWYPLLTDAFVISNISNLIYVCIYIFSIIGIYISTNAFAFTLLSFFENNS